MSENRKSPDLIVGVLGGMGPEATVDFMSEVIGLTDASRDQEHVRMIVDHNPQVPDRQAAMRGDPGPVRRTLADMARRLEAAGAHFLVMPCNTAHAFVGDAVAAVSVPFISIIDTTVQSIREQHPGIRRVGLLATDACIAAGVYQDALRRAGLELTLPDADAQRRSMELIFRVKSGDTGEAVRAAMREIAITLADAGAQAVIAGCTEIPLVLDAVRDGVALISSTRVLASRSVDYATGARALPTDNLTKR
ncbi:MAG: amino acid racemase [Gammaproteobacteria bacterium]|nr:amino acid racemase [Gammaproteobacteria bacterium]MDH4253410.1 amino acid racemase [Gammaproteobacteria bacterium]MDH5309227.1 amino acid racemase [Gammaproteobacteria bacterium]